MADQYEVKAEEYRKQAKETEVPASLTEKVKQSAEDIQKRKLEEKAPTTKTGMGKAFKAGGKVGGASKRADGVAQRGKTRGRMC